MPPRYRNLMRARNSSLIWSKIRKRCTLAMLHDRSGPHAVFESRSHALRAWKRPKNSAPEYCSHAAEKKSDKLSRHKRIFH